MIGQRRMGKKNHQENHQWYGFGFSSKKDLDFLKKNRNRTIDDFLGDSKLFFERKKNKIVISSTKNKKSQSVENLRFQMVFFFYYSFFLSFLFFFFFLFFFLSFLSLSFSFF